VSRDHPILCFGSSSVPSAFSSLGNTYALSFSALLGFPPNLPAPFLFLPPPPFSSSSFLSSLLFFPFSRTPFLPPLFRLLYSPSPGVPSSSFLFPIVLPSLVPPPLFPGPLAPDRGGSPTPRPVPFFFFLYHCRQPCPSGIRVTSPARGGWRQTGRAPDRAGRTPATFWRLPGAAHVKRHPTISPFDVRTRSPPAGCSTCTSHGVERPAAPFVEAR